MTGFTPIIEQEPTERFSSLTRVTDDFRSTDRRVGGRSVFQPDVIKIDIEGGGIGT